MQILDEIDRVQNAVERAGDVGDDGSQDDREEHPMAADQLESLGDLLPDRRRRRPSGAWRLRRADQQQRDGRDHERDGIHEDRERCADELDQAAGDAGAADLGDRRAGRELAVPLDDAIHADQGRDVRGVRRAEQGAEAALEEHDEVELLHPQGARRVGDRNRKQEERPGRVRADQERPPSDPVDPRAGEEPDEQHRQAAGHHDQCHLERPGAEHEQGDERHGRAGHDGAELGDGLAGP